MKRRCFLNAVAALPAAGVAQSVWAHHGWSSFDQSRPIYLEGLVSKVNWRNPHAEMAVSLSPDLRLPADLAQRQLPAQTAPVDGKALLAAAVLPKRKDKVWEVELAPLTRLEAWRVAEIPVGTKISLVGFTFSEEKGEPILRAEYLFLNEKTYGLRSSPA